MRGLSAGAYAAFLPPAGPDLRARVGKRVQDTIEHLCARDNVSAHLCCCNRELYAKKKNSGPEMDLLLDESSWSWADGLDGGGCWGEGEKKTHRARPYERIVCGAVYYYHDEGLQWHENKTFFSTKLPWSMMATYKLQQWRDKFFLIKFCYMRRKKNVKERETPLTSPYSSSIYRRSVQRAVFIGNARRCIRN